MPDERRRHANTGGRSWPRIGLAILSALVALAAAGVAAYSWIAPRSAASTIAYVQTGSLAYAAPTAPTSVYGSGGVTTRDPVYVKVVPSLRIDYTWRFRSAAASRLHGTEQLVARVTSGTGLVRAVPLQPMEHFTGDVHSTSVTLAFSTLASVADAFAKALGNSGGAYAVSIVPDVTVRGRLAGSVFATAFRQPTAFSYSSFVFVPTGSTPASARAATGTGTSQIGAPLVATTGGSVPGRVTRTGKALLGIPVLDARAGALALLVAALGALILLGRPMLRDRLSGDERVRFGAHLGAALVDVRSLPDPGRLAVVELRALDGLAQVARRLECPLLHHRGPLGDEYAVVDNGTLYRYTVPAGTRRHALGTARQNGETVDTGLTSPARAVAANGHATTS